jgi:hypothetical protein
MYLSSTYDTSQQIGAAPRLFGFRMWSSGISFFGGGEKGSISD